MSKRLTVQYQGQCNVGHEIYCKCKSRIERIEKQIHNIKQRERAILTCLQQKKSPAHSSIFHMPCQQEAVSFVISNVFAAGQTHHCYYLITCGELDGETEGKGCQEGGTRGAPGRLESFPFFASLLLFQF